MNSNWINHQYILRYHFQNISKISKFSQSLHVNMKEVKVHIDVPTQYNISQCCPNRENKALLEILQVQEHPTQATLRATPSQSYILQVCKFARHLAILNNLKCY